MPRLPLNDYAVLLCEAIRAYDFPAVTCEFEPGGNRIVRTSCRGSMLIVERHVGRLLRSGHRSEVKDGLSNVLYWGWAQTSLAEPKATKFRREVDDDDPMLSDFVNLDKDPPGPGLLGRVNDIGLPGFGMSFTTKILMFLNPARYPVLDKKIARIARNCDFLPLSNILAAGDHHVPMNQHAVAAYERWACWCREIANAVNDAPASRRRDLRAVDVERALFTLADADDHEEHACTLLKGPEGWSVDCG